MKPEGNLTWHSRNYFIEMQSIYKLGNVEGHVSIVVMLTENGSFASIVKADNDDPHLLVANETFE